MCTISLSLLCTCYADKCYEVGLQPITSCYLNSIIVCALQPVRKGIGWCIGILTKDGFFSACVDGIENETMRLREGTKDRQVCYRGKRLMVAKHPFIFAFNEMESRSWRSQEKA